MYNLFVIYSIISTALFFSGTMLLGYPIRKVSYLYIIWPLILLGTAICCLISKKFRKDIRNTIDEII
jgi:hypothetical protein